LLTAVSRVIARQRIEFIAKSRGLQVIEQGRNEFFVLVQQDEIVSFLIQRNEIKMVLMRGSLQISRWENSTGARLPAI